MIEIARGAEAVLFRDGNEVVKVRPEKGFRVKELDSRLRSSRTRREAKILARLSEVIPVPAVSEVKGSSLRMEFVEGKKLSEVIDVSLARDFGLAVGRMHSRDVVHGDLTTSNVIVKDGRLVLIDFGLALVSSRVEDKAVDLRVLERALASRHCERHEELMERVLQGYEESYPDAAKVIERLGTVQARGRHKRR